MVYVMTLYSQVDGTNILEEGKVSRSTLKIKMLCFRKILVTTYKTTQCHNPDKEKF